MIHTWLCRFEDVSREADDGVDVGVAEGCAERRHLTGRTISPVHDHVALLLIGKAQLDVLDVGADAAATGLTMALGATLLVDSQALEELFVCVIGKRDATAPACRGDQRRHDQSEECA